MKNFLKFVFFEVIVFLIMGAITVIEIKDVDLFNSLVSLVKTPASWFIGLSLVFIFSYFFQNMVTSYFHRDIADEEKRKDFFAGFIIVAIITSFITPYIRELILVFFSVLLPYFHIIILQALLIFYLLFKIKGRYEISGRYFLTGQLIVLFYILIILSFI